MGKEIELSTAITDIAAGPFGSNLKVECFVPSGFPIIDGANLKGYKVTDNITKFVTEEKARSLSRSIAHRGDVIVTISGTIGQIAYIPEDSLYDEYLCSQRQFRVSFDSSMVYVPYLVFYFHTFEGQNKILSFANQTGVPALSQPLKNFKKIRLCLPSLQEQRRIASIVETINDKIENNIKINDNLQQQAFSVFDNLIANAENNDYTVSDYAFLNPKRTLAKNQVARSIDMSQLSTSGAFPSGWEMKPFNGGMQFTNGDTLLARITPCLENGKTAFIDFLDDGEVAFGSTEYIVLAPKNDTPPEMLYCLARYPAFVDYAVKNMNGSSGRQRVSAETVGQYRLPLFDKHSLVLFKEVVSPMFLKMRYNSLENMRLAELRDALLPKLMSGEIDVSAVQL